MPVRAQKKTESLVQISDQKETSNLLKVNQHAGDYRMACS